MSKYEVSVVIPVYNEQQSVVNETVAQIKKSLSSLTGCSFEIIVVNDGSKTKFRSYRSTKNAKIISHVVNKGYGASLKTGIKNARFDWIMITDADGTYSNNRAHELVKETERYDMVVASRTTKISHIPLIRRPVKWFLNKFSTFLAGKKIPDLNSGLRVFKKDIALRFWGFFPEKFSFTSTITMICMTRGYDVLYIPMNYYKRKGKSYIHPIKDTIKFISLLYKLCMYFNPLKFFLPFSLLILLVDLIWFVIFSYYSGGLNLTEGTVSLAIASYLTFMLGVLAELIVKSKN